MWNGGSRMRLWELNPFCCRLVNKIEEETWKLPQAIFIASLGIELNIGAVRTPRLAVIKLSLDFRGNTTKKKEADTHTYTQE